MFKHILIATDGSPQSKKAAVRGVALAKAVGARVTGFFAAPPATPIVYRNALPVGYATPQDHARAIARTTAAFLGQIESAANKSRVRYEGVHVTSDFPAEAILQAAKKNKCDLIVMAKHGHSGLRGLLVGSVTQRVTNESGIPVLIFR